MRAAPAIGSVMVILLILFLAVWLILAIVGFAIEGLLWLGVVGVVLVVATAAIGIVRRRVTLARRAESTGPPQ